MAKKMITLDDVVQKQGTLEQQYAALSGASWLSSAEIQDLRLNNPELRNNWFRTGDGAVYQKNDSGNFTLYITSAGLNPVLKAENFSDAVSQIKSTENYKVNVADLSAIVSASKKKNGGVTAVDLSKLSAKKEDNERSYIEFSTTDYKSMLNSEDMKLVQAYHGKGKQFNRSMKMLSDAGKKTTRVYVLNQVYLARYASTEPIARLSALGSFDGNSSAFAGSRYFGNCGAFAFGVRQSTARRAVMPKNLGPQMDVESAVNYLTRQGKEITEPVAKQLLAITNAFYQKR